MAHIVKVCTKETIEKMKKHYIKSIAAVTPNGAIFSAKSSGVTITAYKSGKVMFQGGDCENEAGIWNGGESAGKEVKKSSVSNHTYAPPSNVNALSFIGSDEAGTGDYFGPITVAAAFVDPSLIEKLRSLGVRDSKELNDKQITELARFLVDVVPFSLLILNNEKYNEVQRQGWTQGKMKAMLHEKAIQNLLKKLGDTKPKGILVDQFCEPGIYFRHTGTSGRRDVPIYFATKAESISIAVAAASIIARSAFLKHMNLLSEELGETVPKGAGSHVDQFAAEVIKKHGILSLEHFAKVHFANTEKAKKMK
ncbi:MAG: ribonuclease [Bacillales bacterium]|jgi:ribonuclease HIII|nr:ribonuclease [Bacillales bacterium]